MSPKTPNEDRRGKTPEEREENAERMDIKRAKELLLGATNRWTNPPKLRGGEKLEDMPRLILAARKRLEGAVLSDKNREGVKDYQLPKDEIKKIGAILDQFDPNGFVKSLETELHKSDLELVVVKIDTEARIRAITNICTAVGTLLMIALGVTGYIGDKKLTDQENKYKGEITELTREIETLVKECGDEEKIFTNEPPVTEQAN